MCKPALHKKEEERKEHPGLPQTNLSQWEYERWQDVNRSQNRKVNRYGCRGRHQFESVYAALCQNIILWYCSRGTQHLKTVFLNTPKSGLRSCFDWIKKKKRRDFKIRKDL